MRPVLALAVAALAALGCSPPATSSCPGTPIAVFRFKGPMVFDGEAAALDPVPWLPDCTPDPMNTGAPIRYPHLLPPFDARLSFDEATGDAALCRANGSVLSGERTGAWSFAVEADADAAVLCESACVATLRVVVAGKVTLDPGGDPATFVGILVEVLTEARGACDGCLPLADLAVPPVRACAARYALSGTPG